MTDRIALVLGATGGIGGETAAALERHGWRIRALTRDPEKARARPGGENWEWRQGDVMRPADVLGAAEGVGVIVHAVNPAGYRDWDTTVLPMYESSIAAAKAANARLLTPGSLYNYPFTAAVITEDTPQTATTRKGRIRTQVDKRLEAASREGVRSLVVRAGDFFGPRPGQNWFSQILIKPGKPIRSITYPGGRGMGHCWAYLPDLAETFASLVDREDDLPAFAAFNFQGFWDPDGTEMIAAIGQAIGNPDVAVKSLPWSLVKLVGLFNVTMRETYEMKGFWQNSNRLDNKRLVKFLGKEPNTPINEAVTTTLKALGSL